MRSPSGCCRVAIGPYSARARRSSDQYSSASTPQHRREEPPPGEKNANDVSWQALKASADTLATYSIYPDTKYSNKLIELAQEMIRAQSDPDNAPPNGQPPIHPDNYYPSRNLASVLAFIYDYCYDQLSASLKPQMIALMNDYYDDLSVNGYQAQAYSYAADSNFFGDHRTVWR
jgi:hypothetical protein